MPADLDLLTCLPAMGYRILDRTDPAPAAPEAEIASLRLQLTDGDAPGQSCALARLILLDAQDALIGCLASPDPATVQLAAAGLWECWLNEAGPAARHRVDEGIDLMGAGHLGAARATFEGLMHDFPTWAEAHNKLATVLYLEGELPAAIESCHRVLAMKPDHFGAWNGLTICAIQQDDWPLALRAARESVRLQPHSGYNRQLLELVESRLNAA